MKRQRPLQVGLYGSYRTDEGDPSRVHAGLASALAETSDIDVTMFAYGDAVEPPHPDVTVEHLGKNYDSVSQLCRYQKRTYERREKLDVHHALEVFSYPTDVQTVQWTFTPYELFKRCRSAVPSADVIIGTFYSTCSVREESETPSMWSHRVLRPNDR